MKLNAFWKGLIMSVIGFTVTLFTGSETVSFAYAAIATLGFTTVYFIKNFAMPSISVMGNIDLRDALSGVILAVGMALSSYAAQVLTGEFSWKTLGLAVGGAVVGYLGKTSISKNS